MLPLQDLRTTDERVQQPSTSCRHAGTSQRSLLGRAAAALVGAALATLVGAVPAQAQSSNPSPPTSLQVTTPYPRIAVQPGSTVTFEVSVAAPRTEAVDLALAAVPSGWEATMRGGGFIISGVTAGPERAGNASLEVKVPGTARPGNYTIGVRGTGPSGASDLAIVVKVDAAAESAVEITTDFPEIKGKPTDTFTYDLTVRNNTPEKQVFNLNPTGPDGWEVTASPSSETRASILNVDAGGTGTVRVEAKPPASVAAGTYPVNVRMTNKQQQSGEIALSAVVSGTTSMKLSMADDRVSFSVRAGKTTSRQMQIVNDGSAPLENVTLSASPPADWEVTYEPQTIETVAAGKTENVTIRVRPAKGALSGDYLLDSTASAGTASANAQLRVAVKQSRVWGVLGVGLIVIALGALWGVFRRFGRR